MAPLPSQAASPAPRLQFDRAAYTEAPSSLLHCGYCGRGIDELRYEIFGQPACDICTRQAQTQIPADCARVFARACGYGVIAALGSGLMLLGLMAAIPGMLHVGGEFFAAWGVGWSIARAIRVGGRGALGRKYQAVGTVLAYAAMVIPMQAFLSGFAGPWWLYPVMLLRPVAFLFTDLKSMGAVMVFAASIAMTWAWRGLKGSPSPIHQL